MSSRVAIITFMDTDPAYPSQGLPGTPGYPSHGLPGSPGYPSQGLPGLPPGAAQLPVFPFDPTRPDQGLPPAPGTPGTPLPPEPGYPSHQPIAPGGRFVVKWWACHGLILVPDHSLPPTAEPKG